MRRTLLSCRSLYFLILSLCDLVESSRYFHNAIYDESNQRILFTGGATPQFNQSGDVLSLDLSAPFNRTTWKTKVLTSMPHNVSDAASVLDANGLLHVIGGEQTTCSPSINLQVFNTSSNQWSTSTPVGDVPTSRSGARAAIVDGGDIVYFGGKSLTSCNSSQYYFNSIYQLNPFNSNWSLPASSSPPVAESDMTMTTLADGTVLVVSGESVASNGKASWVGTSQFATYDSNSSAWSYLSTTSDTVFSARSGHSAASNGTHTFIYGGALADEAPQQKFFSVAKVSSTFDVSVLNGTYGSSAPTTSLYGHSATMTANGIMIIAFGLQGAATSTVYNDDLYLYDTVSDQWLDVYNPLANFVPTEHKKKQNRVVVSIVVCCLIVLVCLGSLFLFMRHRRQRLHRKSKNQYPSNRLGSYTPDSAMSIDEKGPFSATAQIEQVHLPPWASAYACQARSHTPVQAASRPDEHETHDPSDEYIENREQQEYDVQEVQFAFPTTPQVLTFTAPRLQLRIVNPETAIESVLEPKDLKSQIQTTRPRAPITNESDLEALRAECSDQRYMLRDVG